jgi:glycerol-3-phosphate cytidylyltransferase
VIGVTFGTWDLLHVGHVRFLKECLKKCSALYVYVQKDPSLDRPTKNRPVQSLEERKEQVLALSDKIFVYDYDDEEDVKRILQSYSIPDLKCVYIRFLGSEYKDLPITALMHLPIVFIPRDHSYSSSELRRRVYQAEAAKYVAQDTPVEENNYVRITTEFSKRSPRYVIDAIQDICDRHE